MATPTSANEASKALNDLLHYSPKDQDALLEVLENYFTSPEDLEDTTGTGQTYTKKINKTIWHTD